MTQRLLNALPSPPDPRDYPHAPTSGAQKDALLSRFTLTGLGPVLDQGSTPECTCYSAVGWRQWQEKRDGHGVVPFAPDALYALVKALELKETGQQFDGAYLRDVLRILKGTGTPTASGAIDGKIATYVRVDATSIPAMKAALTQGPLYVALSWDANWFYLPTTKVLRNPLGQNAGGHAVYLWGWDDDVNGGSWLLRNSWGKWSKGGNGNAYLAHRHFASHGWEAWLATDVKGDA